MAVPKKKTSKRRKNIRRSHHGLKMPSLIICSNCKKPISPNIICPYCGFYKGKKVVELRKIKRSKKGREKK